MKEQIDDGGSAFPHPEFPDVGGHNCDHSKGIFIRDYFAAKAMEGYLANGDHENLAIEFSRIGGYLGPDAAREANHRIAKSAYAIADAMILAREAK